MLSRNDRGRAQTERNRTGQVRGHVGRDVGDQPYIMDLVLHEHFLGGIDGTKFVESGKVGTANAIGSALGTYMALVTGATANSTVVADTGAVSKLLGFQRDANLRARIIITTTIDGNSRLFVGLATSQALATVADGMFIGVDGSVSTTYFVAVCRDGGIATTKVLDGSGGTTAAAIDTARHEVAIVCDSMNAQVRFYFDRALSATITTDLPDDASDFVVPHFSAQNGASAVDRRLLCDVIVLAEAAP